MGSCGSKNSKYYEWEGKLKVMTREEELIIQSVGKTALAKV